MGLEIFQIGDGSKAAQLWVVSDNEWTSVITVQGKQHVNVGIVVSDAISDILSAQAFSASISGINSFFTGVVTLQRRMPEGTGSYDWRDVAEWSINSSAVGVGGSENITDKAEPETVQYRLGVKDSASAYVGGTALVRLGTS